MVDFITRLIQPIVQIKREEWRKVILMFLYFALTIATLYILKPVRNSIFLAAHGAASLRYAYVGEGLFLILITFAYVGLSKLLTQRNVLFTVTTAFFLSNIIAFWWLFRAGHVEWLAYFFYIWVAAYSITIVTQFWTLANDVFNPQEAKRLFGFIISGGSLGGVLGGLATRYMAERVGTENLLLVGAGLLALCMVLIHMIGISEPSAHEEEKTAQKRVSQNARLRDKSTWKLFIGSRYFLLIAAIISFSKVSSALIDNQFNSVVEHAIVETNARTAFFGGFLAVLNGVSFLIQLVVASRILRSLGVGISLLLLPVGLCFGAAATAFIPVLGIAAATKLYDGSFNYSINQMGKEILYLPIPRRTRYRIKPLIDMLVYRSSKSLAGLLIICLTPLLGIPDEKIGIIVLILAPLWIWAVWAGRDEYMQAIKELLLSRKTDSPQSMSQAEQATDVLVNLEGEHSFQKLKTFLAHRSSVARKMSATACLAFYWGTRDVDRVKKLVQEMMRYEALELKGVNVDLAFERKPHDGNKILDEYLVRLQITLNQDPNTSLCDLPYDGEKKLLSKLSECLQNLDEDISDQRKAILILTQLGTQDAVDVLLTHLAAAQDHSIRFNLIRSLNRIRAKKEQREFNSPLIKKEVLKEIRNHEALVLVLAEYQSRKSSAKPEEDYLFATLAALREESLERIFRLLALLYASDIIHVIYDRLVELDPDRHIRANALELLENVAEPELTCQLRPIFGEEARAKPKKQEFVEAVQSFLESGDRWLQVCAVFLIVELGLADFYPVLGNDRFARVPIVREATEIALIKMRGRGVSPTPHPRQPR